MTINFSFEQAANTIKGTVYHPNDTEITYASSLSCNNDRLIAAITRVEEEADGISEDPELCAALANKYRHGLHLDEEYKNPERAEKLAIIAANAGNSFGQAVLGLIYLPSPFPKDTCDNDYKKSAEWLLTAAKQGSGLAAGYLLSIREALNLRTDTHTLMGAFNKREANVFYNHEVIGTRDVRQIREDLKLLQEIDSVLANIYAEKAARNEASVLKVEEPA